MSKYITKRIVQRAVEAALHCDFASDGYQTSDIINLDQLTDDLNVAIDNQLDLKALEQSDKAMKGLE